MEVFTLRGHPDSWGYLASVEHVGLSHRLEAGGPEPSSDVVRLEPVIKSWTMAHIGLGRIIVSVVQLNCIGSFGTIVCGKIAV